MAIDKNWHLFYSQKFYLYLKNLHHFSPLEKSEKPKKNFFSIKLVAKIGQNNSVFYSTFSYFDGFRFYSYSNPDLKWSCLNSYTGAENTVYLADIFVWLHIWIFCPFLFVIEREKNVLHISEAIISERSFTLIMIFIIFFEFFLYLQYDLWKNRKNIILNQSKDCKITIDIMSLRRKLSFCCHSLIIKLYVCRREDTCANLKCMEGAECTR